MTLYLSKTADDRHYSTDFPDTLEITDDESFLKSQRYDHMMCQMTDGRRKKVNFIGTDCLFADIDNSHSEDPKEWMGIKEFMSLVTPYEFFIATSKSHGIEKEGKAARPRFHILFPITRVEDPVIFKNLMDALYDQEFASRFDENCNDIARMFKGIKCKDISYIHHKGEVTIDRYLYQCSSYGKIKKMHAEGKSVPRKWENIPWEQMTEGNRDDRMFQVGTTQLAKGREPLAVISYMKECNSKMAEPFDNEELERVINSVLSHAREKYLKHKNYINSEKTEETVKRILGVL